MSRERERERERIIDQKRRKETDTHTERERKNHRSKKKKGNIHTHQERKSERYEIFFSIFFFFGVLGFEEKGHGWFGREKFWVWKKSCSQYRKKKEEGKKKVLTPFVWVVKMDRCQNFK